jgi:membrane-associated protease RseP (regulator of RpoE activity)
MGRPRKDIMPDTLKTAVIAALKDQDVRRAMTEHMRQAVQGTLQTALPEVVKAAVLGTQQAAGQKKIDPYRTTIYYLAGLIAFCLAVITGIFNAFPDPPIDTGDVVYRMLGGVLAWISITALVATVCMAVVQILKHMHRQDANAQGPGTATLALLMGIPTFFGAMSVTYCVRGGMAVLHGNTELIGLLEAFCKLVHF